MGSVITASMLSATLRVVRARIPDSESYPPSGRYGSTSTFSRDAKSRAW
jgi:hypothetical protein